MQKILTILIFIFSMYDIFSQINLPVTSNVFLFPQGNPIGELNGLGTSGILNNISNIGSINPAALSNYNDISFGLSYQFETNINEAWIADIGYKREMDFVPQSAGIIFPIYNLSLGLSMRQSYNGIMDIGPIPVTTTEFPDGTGEFIDFQENTILYDYSFLASYNIENIIEGWNLSLGGRYSIYNMNMTNEITGFAGTSLNFRGNNWAGGIVVENRSESNKYLQLGIFYEKIINLTENHEDGLTVTPVSDTSRPLPFYIVTNYIAQFPARLKFDFDIRTVPRFIFLGSISEILWKNIEQDSPNEIEYSGSVVYGFSDIISSSIGFYSTRKKYNAIDSFFNTNDNLQAFFITLGTTIKTKNIIMDLSIADSHVFSGDWRKQTIGKISFACEL